MFSLSDPEEQSRGSEEDCKSVKQTTVDRTIKKILDYGARPLSEFNKFEALDMLEALQNTARDHGATKAGFFRLAYQSTRSKLDLPVEHFRSLVLKAGFHMIANDRRRSRIAERRSQTIAKRAVSI